MKKYILIAFIFSLCIFMTSCKKEAKITLNINNEIKEVRIEKGTTLGSTYNPNIEGYTFEGWYLDSSFNNAFSFIFSPQNGRSSPNLGGIFSISGVGFFSSSGGQY